MAGQTVVPIGSATAKKVYSVATFHDSLRKATFRRNLTGPAPTQSSAERKAKGQTSPDYPFVRVTDLRRTMGYNVSVDMFNIITGKPVMGDRKLSGRMMSLSSSSMDIRIDQYRGGVDQGGRMTQQRTVHNLRTMARAQLSGWGGRCEDQLMLVHAAGARGYDTAHDWVVPLQSDPEFSEICVNPVLPPTPNRRLFGGNATGAADIDSTDKLTLDVIDAIRVTIEEMAFPMQPVRFPGDPAVDEQPLYVLYVTPRQWHDLQTATAGQNWRNFLAQAYERARGWSHPLFTGTPGMWNGILVKKTFRPITFPAGELVEESDASGIVTTTAANATFHRAVLLGAQAVAEVYGRHGESGYHANYHEEMTDHGNTVEQSLGFMGGKSKLRFTNSSDELTDHGVIAVDCAVSA